MRDIRRERWRETHPIREAAHQAVARALKSGALVRQPCEECARHDGVEAHHEDYTKPLTVRWLCRFHHLARHRELRAQSVGWSDLSGEEIRAARLAIGMKSKDLADILGISQSFLSNIERCEKFAPPWMLIRMPPAIREPLVRARIAELEKLL
jgi:hypothetical protein